VTTLTESQLNEAIESLRRNLDVAERRLRESQDEIQNLRHASQDGRNTWAQPQEWTNVGPLPIPRLELRWVRAGQEDVHCWYVLVRRDADHGILGHPFGLTRCNGSFGSRGFLHDGRVDLPIHAASLARYDAGHLNLPLYAVTEGGDVDELLQSVTGVDGWPFRPILRSGRSVVDDLG
jgi:hypothetical protein